MNIIPNTNNMYAITTLGDVYNIKTNKKLKKIVNKAGYHHVGLCVNNKITHHPIHLLMAIVYLGYKPYNKLINIVHLDGNKLNNDLSNLQLIQSSW